MILIIHDNKYTSKIAKLAIFKEVTEIENTVDNDDDILKVFTVS